MEARRLEWTSQQACSDDEGRVDVRTSPMQQRMRMCAVAHNHCRRLTMIALDVQRSDGGGAVADGEEAQLGQS